MTPKKKGEKMINAEDIKKGAVFNAKVQISNIDENGNIYITLPELFGGRLVVEDYNAILALNSVEEEKPDVYDILKQFYKDECMGEGIYITLTYDPLFPYLKLRKKCEEAVYERIIAIVPTMEEIEDWLKVELFQAKRELLAAIEKENKQ